MGIQKYFVELQPFKVDILNDNISFMNTHDLYLLDTRKNESSYDFYIVSAHSNEFLKYKAKGKTVAVVSYIPDMEDASWPGFYTNLCMCDIIAADSYNAKLLEAVTYPARRIINLDGCSPVQKQNESKSKATILCPLDPRPDQYWTKFKNYIQRSHGTKYTVLEEGYSYGTTVGIAFHPLPPVLASVMVPKYNFAKVGYDPVSSAYLDARNNHHLNSALANLIHVAGEAPSQVLKGHFDTFMEDLEVLFAHSKSNEINIFDSNANVFDRIFHEINRTNT